MDENQIREIVFVALGSASMCWLPRPTGEFDSIVAAEIGEKLMEKIKEFKNECR